jgi:uncharacterized membrane protein
MENGQQDSKGETGLVGHLRAIRFPLFLFCAIVVSLAGYILWAHGQLPERIAVHFNVSGRPDRWSGKGELTGVMLMVVILFFLLFGVGAMLARNVPVKWWNLPNRDYWLAPERSAETMAVVSKTLLHIGIVTLILMGYIHWDVVQANLVRPDHRIRVSLVVISAFAAWILILTIRMTLRFSKSPVRDSSEK